MKTAAFAVALFALAAAAHAGDTVRGAEIYKRHCASCHGPSGSGVWPGAPNLAQREAMMKTDQALLEALRRGRGAMPAYRGMITDGDLLNVIAYLRTLAK